MDYQINVNYHFTAGSETEAKDKATAYILGNLKVRRVDDTVLSPVQVFEQCKGFRNRAKEHFCVLFLDTQNRVAGKQIVSVGTLNSSLIHPRECFRSAIVRNCCSILIAHNHPSGSLEPSLEDLAVTKRLVDAGKLLGIDVLDHVIVTKVGYMSFKEESRM